MTEADVRQARDVLNIRLVMDLRDQEDVGPIHPVLFQPFFREPRQQPAVGAVQ